VRTRARGYRAGVVRAARQGQVDLPRLRRLQHARVPPDLLPRREVREARTEMNWSGCEARMLRHAGEVFCAGDISRMRRRVSANVHKK
jgi:hypothetical protein